MMQLAAVDQKDIDLDSPLKRLVPRWLSTVPLYRNRGDAGFYDGVLHGEGLLQGLPLITKEDIKTGFPANFLRPGQDLDCLVDAELVELEHTSGTSQDRTPLILGAGWWQEQEERALRKNRFVARVLDEFPGTRRVTLNSPFCSGEICYRGTPSYNDRIVGNTLFLSLNRHPLLWDELDLRRMTHETLEWRPQFLDVDPVYAVPFALYCERHLVRIPGLQFIVSSYEYLSVVHRRILERVFRVPVFNLYGSTETGHLLMENERGEMVPSFETAHLEVMDADADGVGELIVTTLTNEYMPLIRYRIGDLVERFGTTLHPHFRLHGRSDASFRRSDGFLVTLWRVDQALADISGIKHYQLAQPVGGNWQLSLVPEQGHLESSILSELVRLLADLLDARDRIEARQVPALLAGPSGKFALFQP